MKKATIIKIHIAYWIFSGTTQFIAFTLPYYTPGGQGEVLYWITSVLNVLTNVAEFYLFYSILIPLYILGKSDYFKFVLVAIPVMLLAMSCRFLNWNSYTIVYGSMDFVNDFKAKFEYLLAQETYYPILALMVRYIEYWVDSEYKKSKLSSLTLASKIDFLKSQISPHFLFNTLNNVYALSMTSREKTSVALTKLQDTFEYLKKIEHESTVTIEEEVAYLQSFVELSKMRVSNSDNVRVDVESISHGRRIYPMLLIPFVENAFKHSNLNDEDNYITIKLESNHDFLKLTVENSIPKHVKSKDKQHGIGLSNLKERLKMLYPNGDYLIETYIENETHYAKLKIDYAV
jgi:two-component system, LytTR family, sensor kinase